MIRSLSRLFNHAGLLPVLSGVFIGTSYIPFPPWASLFCFVPLWLFWSRQTRLKPVLMAGLVTSFIFTLIGFNWMAYVLHEFAHLPWFFSIIGLIIYALIAHLFVPFAGLVWFLGQRTFQWSPHLSLILMALITVLCEANSLTLFDWNFGYTWYGSNVPIYHWAEIIGFSGLSAVTLLTNLPLFYAWQYRKQVLGKTILATVASGFVILNLGGWWLQQRLPKPDATLTTLLVQGNVGNTEKLAAELGKGYDEEILSRYLKLTEKGITGTNKKIDFALWPETAFPFLHGVDYQYNAYPQLLSAYLEQRQLALITGAYSADSQTRLVTNSLFLIDNHGRLVEPHYSKTILLAFGEFIPGEDWLPEIRNYLPATGHFARGQGPITFNWQGFKIGPQICYESLFPQFSKGLADLGAQFIVNVTNDAWYGSWQEPYQHMYMTLARGVEFRRPVLRVTNTGISTVSLASGDILERSPLHQAWSGVYDVAYLKNPPPTFYQQWFWLMPSLLWGSLAVALAFGGYRKWRA